DTPTAFSFPATGASAEYREGLYVGYRYYATAGVDVRFPFGFGLSYTSFGYADLAVTDAGASFAVTNTGDVAAADVAQLYVRRVSDGAIRPAIELKGFCKVHLEPGETARVTIPFDRHTFRHFDAATNAWVTERGQYEILVGPSSVDHPLAASHDVDGVNPSTPDPELPSYAAAAVKHVSDEEFTRLLGRPLAAATSDVLGLNDPLRAMHEAKSPLARLAAKVLRSLIDRSERKGKPDLNLYFLYNMPFRAIGKMTNGSVSTPMVEQILRIVNGHLFRGLGSLVSAFFRNMSTSRRLRRELESTAAAAAAK
ncbi:MAG: fibronectin type III-like domain-contianing protein, partial [Demequina sp.]|uniref:fibronectin type III-like domain-contianing protein n=1 Tax=Demequina sp. TaxID=2050685 RepID=UPI003A863F14